MIQFETILLMLAVAVVLLAASRRWHLPYPVLLATAGAAVAFTPIDVNFHLEPDLVLALFVAPVLLDAAYDISTRDLKRQWFAVGSLAVIVVALTTLAVAWVVHALVPGIPWAAAITIGAVVAPPDAAASSTVLRTVGLPHRIGVILEGEALLNDASSLLIYRLALAAVASGGTLGAEAIAPAFLLSVLGSIAAGPALAWIVVRLVRHIDDVPSSIIAQFVSTFLAWVIAERLKLSPILTVVTYAMTLARSPVTRQPARMRVASNTVWATAVVVLNVFAFLLIGLELGPLIDSAKPGEPMHWSGVGAAVLATVVIVRLAWSLGMAAFHGRMHARHRSAAARAEDGGTEDGGATLSGAHGDNSHDARSPGWRSGLIVGWAGTRGIVTVATALALPHDFPERSMLLFIAFFVTLGTLLLQGLTLRPLVVRLGVRDDEPVDRETRNARVRTARAALQAIDGETGDEAQFLRKELETECRVAAEATEGEGRPSLRAAGLRATVLKARRDRLHEMRRDGQIGDDAFRRIQEELDLAELATQTRT